MPGGAVHWHVLLKKAWAPCACILAVTRSSFWLRLGPVLAGSVSAWGRWWCRDFKRKFFFAAVWCPRGWSWGPLWDTILLSFFSGGGRRHMALAPRPTT